MRLHFSCFLLIIFYAVVFALSVFAENSSNFQLSYGNYSNNVCSEGLLLIRDGRIDDALSLLLKNPRTIDADPLRELRDLVQIVELQESLETETHPILWLTGAEKLKRLCLEKEVFLESFDITTQIFSRIATVENGMEIINVCIAFHHTADALAFVSELETKFSGNSDAKNAIAIAKCRVFLAMQETEKARNLVRQVHMDSLHTPELLLQLAKVQASTRQNASAVKTLVRCFESTPPLVLHVMKAEARDAPDFASIASTKEFKAAMETMSTQIERAANCPAKIIQNNGNMFVVPVNAQFYSPQSLLRIAN